MPLAAAAFALGGCVEDPAYRPVDLQLDLPGLVPTNAALARTCVAGVGERQAGARLEGRLVFTGVPATGPVDVVIDLFDEAGTLLTQGRGDQVDGYAVGERVDCVVGLDSGDWPVETCEPCVAEGKFAEQDEPSWVLAIRFTGEAP
ncbi:hypothetical protein L6R49_11075 [Myxococcota bacterium]|nr:hypothetical protein [Myxococcota bacterium]